MNTSYRLDKNTSGYQEELFSVQTYPDVMSNTYTTNSSISSDSLSPKNSHIYKQDSIAHTLYKLNESSACEKVSAWLQNAGCTPEFTYLVEGAMVRLGETQATYWHNRLLKISSHPSLSMILNTKWFDSLQKETSE
jgi:hypothetical protein